MYMARNVVNLAVWLVFVCKLVYQKHNKSVHICKSYCEKISGTFFYVDTVYIYEPFWYESGAATEDCRLDTGCHRRAADKPLNNEQT